MNGAGKYSWECVRGLRVGILIGGNIAGGSERQTAILARELGRRGLDITVFFEGRPFANRGRSEVDFSHCRTHYLWRGVLQRIGGHRLSTAYLKLRLRRANIQLLHCFNINSDRPLYGSQAAMAAGVRPVVAGVRDLRFAEDMVFREQLKPVARAVTGFTCNSHEIASQLLQFGIVHRDRLRVIENGIELPVLDGRADEPPPQEPKVLFSGSLVDVKDPLCFVRSAILLLKAGRRYRFVIAGEGELRPQVESAIAEAGVASSFDLLGAVRPECVPYARARLLVNTSLSEGTSNSILEALAHGTPVVATAVGGTKQFMRGRPFGSLVGPRDPASISAAIDQWMKLARSDWAAASDGARAFVRERYSLARMANDHCALYRWAVGQYVGQPGPHH